MLWYILAGVCLGALGMWFVYFSVRRELVQVEEEKQTLWQERQIVVDFMHSLVESIGEGVSRETLYQQIVRTAILSTGGLAACVYERGTNDILKKVAVEGLFPPMKPLDGTYASVMTRAKFIEQVLQTERFEWGEGLIGSVAKSGRGVLIANGRKDPRVVNHKDSSLAIHSLILVPIIFREKTIGVVAIANPADNMAFNENDFSLMKSLAEQAGMALHNLKLMQIQMEKKQLDFEISLASNIQSLLLPKVFPNNDYVEIQAIYQPAKKVGGDLYDVFKLADGRIGVAIADVSGKGIPASLLMAICQTNLRHYAKECASPAEVLKSINAVMVSEMRRDMFITMVYAIIDFVKKEIVLARAGHELPMIVRKTPGSDTFTVEEISSDGMALGMVPSKLFNQVIKDVRVSFNADDTFLLYTDGITEAVNAQDEEFSREQLASLVKEQATKPVKEINKQILTAVERFAGSSEKSDDFTLVTVKCLQD